MYIIILLTKSLWAYHRQHRYREPQHRRAVEAGAHGGPNAHSGAAVLPARHVLQRVMPRQIHRTRRLLPPEAMPAGVLRVGAPDPDDGPRVRTGLKALPANAARGRCRRRDVSHWLRHWDRGRVDFGRRMLRGRSAARARATRGTQAAGAARVLRPGRDQPICSGVIERARAPGPGPGPAPVAGPVFRIAPGQLH